MEALKAERLHGQAIVVYPLYCVDVMKENIYVEIIYVKLLYVMYSPCIHSGTQYK